MVGPGSIKRQVHWQVQRFVKGAGPGVGLRAGTSTRKRQKWVGRLRSRYEGRSSCRFGNNVTTGEVQQALKSLRAVPQLPDRWYSSQNLHLAANGK